jgi:hypothetical protein
VDPAEDGINFYAYCKGNPLNFSDPYGLCAKSVTLIGSRSSGSKYGSKGSWEWARLDPQWLAGVFSFGEIYGKNIEDAIAQLKKKYGENGDSIKNLLIINHNYDPGLISIGEDSMSGENFGVRLLPRTTDEAVTSFFSC